MKRSKVTIMLFSLALFTQSLQVYSGYLEIRDFEPNKAKHTALEAGGTLSPTDSDIYYAQLDKIYWDNPVMYSGDIQEYTSVILSNTPGVFLIVKCKATGPQSSCTITRMDERNVSDLRSSLRSLSSRPTSSSTSRPRSTMVSPLAEQY